nr:ABC transporter permease subunit [Lachnotalea sp. AF33-28]
MYLKRVAKIKKYLPIYFMMVPGILYLLINNYLPMAGIVIAFKKLDWKKGIFKSDWVGLENFTYLFKTDDAFIMTRNTILYNLLFITLGMICAVSVAILLNEIRSKTAKKLYQSLILLPYLMSMVIISYLAYAILSNETGFLNKSILPLFGMEPISWYQEKKYWPFILTIINIWKSVGFSCIIYLASIVGINPEYYEAARLEGAGKWKQIRYITLPLLMPTVITMFILNIGGIFRSDFGLFYLVPRGSGILNSVTQTIDTYVYKGLMQQGNLSMSSAAGVYQSVVGFITILASNALVRKLDKESALF